MGKSGEPEVDLSFEELVALRALSRALDDAVEESLKQRESLTATFARVLPRLLELTGARAIAVRTRNEELALETWSHGDFGDRHGEHYLEANPFGVRLTEQGTWVSQVLDLQGLTVGALGLLFEGDARSRSARLSRVVEEIGEQLDTVLAQVQTAAEKHELVLRLNSLLANRVLDAGLDAAIRALAERVRLPGLMIVYRDVVRPSQLHYRGYRFGRMEHASGGEHPFEPLESLIRSHGTQLVAAGDQRARTLWKDQRSVEAVLISSASSSETLGKIYAWSDRDGFSAYTLELVQLLASALSQRLVDYNRERVHLSQFFAPDVIDELLTDPRYEASFLTPRDEEVGILFADINGFTRICETVLEAPTRIGRFVDRWSDGVVDLLWKHGGVFDKMVGDCVIGLFGPPFFRSPRGARAEQVLRCALDIQAFTRAMSADPEVSRIAERLGLPGLGVAIGVNLAPAYCGLFGPNSSYTGFSTGMNQTARLQSLGGFRETLVMRSVSEALKGTDLRDLKWGDEQEAAVKNVAQPLRFHLLGPEE